MAGVPYGIEGLGFGVLWLARAGVLVATLT